MSGFQRPRILIALMAIGVLVHSAVPATAQEIAESQQSVLVFDIKLDRMMESAKAMGADLDELDASMPM